MCCSIAHGLKIHLCVGSTYISLGPVMYVDMIGTFNFLQMNLNIAASDTYSSGTIFLFSLSTSQPKTQLFNRKEMTYGGRD